DPRLIVTIPAAVAGAAMDSGVARKPIIDMAGYRHNLRSRLDPTADSLTLILEKVKSRPQRVVFAEGEEERAIRAAIAFRNAGYGTPILIGREDRIRETVKTAGLGNIADLEIRNASLSTKSNDKYVDFLYRRLQRKGAMLRDCQRMVNQDRNTYGACMVATGDADAMVTGLTRSFMVCYDEITRVIDPVKNSRVFGLSILVGRGRTVFVADTTVQETPEAEHLVDIAIQTAAKARQMGQEPRVAFLSFASFGLYKKPMLERIQKAVALMDQRGVDFEYDGEMTADVALDYELMKRLYPFSRLSGPANVLVMPGLHAANISTKMMQKLGGVTLVGPLLIGLDKPAQVVQMGASANDLVTAAALAAHDALHVKDSAYW
ncbi:MAG TPA: phosphate acyltransferase, partial [Azospirillaceae bacterium]|nr:phosphate acyltransferase [Azospirillaceae bacterium]